MDYVEVGTAPVAQGELLILRVDSLPVEGLKPMAVEDGRFIVGHSETGHHHTILKEKGVEVFESNDNNILFLKVTGKKTQAFLKHERGFDTHKTHGFKDGNYIIRRQQESFLEGFRPALD